jgi:hypothetical protein
MTAKAPLGDSDGDDAERASIVSEFAAAEAAVAAAQAEAVRVLAKAAAHAARVTRSKPAREHDMALRSMAAELACATRISDRTVQRRIDSADALVTRYPVTMAAWADGRISHAHVRAVTEAGLPLGDSDRALFDQAAVPVCVAETPAGAAHLLGALAEKLKPRTLTERHREARDARSVRVGALSDGMAELIVILPLTLAHAIHDRLTQQARLIKNVRERARDDVAEAARAVEATSAPTGAEDAAARARTEIIASDERTLDHIRADLLADTLLTGSPDADPTRAGDKPGELGAIRARIQVVVPVLVAAGESDDPAELVGHGPIDADTARRLVGDSSGFDRVLTHPISGAPLCVDRYAPSSAIQRFLAARDRICRFPGCRMPAIRCDIDHSVEYVRGGATDVCNLAHLCKRHHPLKHVTPWAVRQRAGGVLEWTSPLGHTYIDEPAGYGSAAAAGFGPPTGERGVRFISDGDPPPF